MNPDIIVPPDAIEDMVQYMRANPEIGLLVPKIVNEAGEMQFLCKRKPSVAALFGRRFLPKSMRGGAWLTKILNDYEMRDSDYHTILEPDFASGCFMMFKSSVFAKLKGFDERFFLYFEDTDISLRAKEISKVIYYPEVSITHCWKGGAKTNWKLTMIMMGSAFKYFQKWGWKWK